MWQKSEHHCALFIPVFLLKPLYSAIEIILPSAYIGIFDYCHFFFKCVTALKTTQPKLKGYVSKLK